MYMYTPSTLSMIRSGSIHTDYFSLNLENYQNPPNIPKDFSSDEVNILSFLPLNNGLQCDKKRRNEEAKGRHGFVISGFTNYSFRFVMILLLSEEV